MSTRLETVYHATVLSNLARGYDKYLRQYSKAGVPESRFPEKFFVLKKDELHIGLKKAHALLGKLSLAGNRVVVLESRLTASEVLKNSDSGLGRFIQKSVLDVSALYLLEANGELKPYSVEDALAESLELIVGELHSFEDLAPRSFSYLPIAIGCEARCPFCFSKASASKEQKNGKRNLQRLRQAMREAKARGAERAVITGGGEPGLLSRIHLLEAIRETSLVFSKTVMITNGYFLGKEEPTACLASIRQLDQAGLGVLSISRHHWDQKANSKIFSLDYDSEKIASSWNATRGSLRQLKLRWVCVLQKGGVESADSLAAYLDWAAGTGVGEICFKELYVSTSRESVYYSEAENRWCAERQVALKLVMDYVSQNNWKKVSELPWGAPIFEGVRRGHRMRIAAYTEPSLFWERKHGIARSWNLMADGRVLVSLEDRKSEILKNELSNLSPVP